MSKPIIAIVGRPNVGKSMLFNKIIGRRLSIVEDTPGVTRDRIYGESDWNGRKFTLVDTGGIEPSADSQILAFMRQQAEIAIQHATVILFVCDIKTGLTASDQEVANMLLAGETAKEKWRTVLQDESDALKRVVTLLLNARTLSRRNEFSLRHLCDLYAAIKFLDYDEEELKAILPRFLAIGFSRRAVAVLGRRLLLTEGFMPLRPAKRAKDL